MAFLFSVGSPLLPALLLFFAPALDSVAPVLLSSGSLLPSLPPSSPTSAQPLLRPRRMTYSRKCRAASFSSCPIVLGAWFGSVCGHLSTCMRVGHALTCAMPCGAVLCRDVTCAVPCCDAAIQGGIMAFLFSVGSFLATVAFYASGLYERRVHPCRRTPAPMHVHAHAHAHAHARASFCSSACHCPHTHTHHTHTHARLFCRSALFASLCTFHWFSFVAFRGSGRTYDTGTAGGRRLACLSFLCCCCTAAVGIQPTTQNIPTLQATPQHPTQASSNLGAPMPS